MNKFTLSLLGITLACGLVLPAAARDVTGKVMAVYHEPVVINNQTLDHVLVTVNNCDTNQWETFSYAPGAVSDDNSLGFLFRDLATAARSVVTQNQYMSSVSGHVTLTANPQNVVQKTTFWGYNWECGHDLDGKAGAAPSSAGSPAAQPTAKPAPSANPLGKFRKFGF